MVFFLESNYFTQRSRADSNRCTSFCRALPNHSATRPSVMLNSERRNVFHDFGLQTNGLFFKNPNTYSLIRHYSLRIQHLLFILLSFLLLPQRQHLLLCQQLSLPIFSWLLLLRFLPSALSTLPVTQGRPR